MNIKAFEPSDIFAITKIHCNDMIAKILPQPSLALSLWCNDFPVNFYLEVNHA